MKLLRVSFTRRHYLDNAYIFYQFVIAWFQMGFYYHNDIPIISANGIVNYSTCLIFHTHIVHEE